MGLLPKKPNKMVADKNQNARQQTVFGSRGKPQFLITDLYLSRYGTGEQAYRLFLIL